MIVLAVQDGHNSSAALMIDGMLVGLLQEERFTKRKNQVAFPRRAIESLVSQHLNGEFSRIDKVLLAGEESDPYWTVLDHYANFGVHDYVREMHEYWHPFFYGGGEKTLYSGDGAYWKEKIQEGKHINQDHNYDFAFLDGISWDEAFQHFNKNERRDVFRRYFNFSGEIKTINHHKCHGYFAAYGYQLTKASLQDALVFTADSEGDGANWSVSTVAADGKLQCLAYGNDNHVARIYKFCTLLLGMKPNEHEYKVMGMSGYSKSRRHIEEAEKVFFNAFDFQDGAFVRPVPLKDSYFDLGRRLEGHRFDNISAAVQNWATEVTRKWMQHWLEKAGKKAICFSGGLSMNIKMNGELLRRLPIIDMSVPASGGDESLCAGACMAEAVEAGVRVAPVPHVYLGGEPESIEAEADWRRALLAAGLDPDEFIQIDQVGAQDVARLLASDEILARCVGPAEFGARALGNRSILANPSNARNLKKINDAIKQRDFWMPFTPSILEEYANELLVNEKSVVSPFMTIGFETRPQARDALAAAIHPGDFSARPQFVQKSTNPKYWEIIDEFRKLTGVPALLNTSLNLHGEPMNYSVRDAILTVARSDLDFLLLPMDRLICKRRALARAMSLIKR